MMLALVNVIFFEILTNNKYLIVFISSDTNKMNKFNNFL